MCLVAEANAWPYRHPRRAEGDPGALVHVTAVRLATGERMEAIVAPDEPLAPDTAAHLELAPEAIVAGLPLEHARAALQAFLRPTDVLAVWGSHTPAVLVRAGVRLEGPSLDLRHALRVMASASPGALEDLAERLPHGPSLGMGRAGRRLALLAVLAPALSSGGSLVAEALCRDLREG